jgi:hypothetical protein
VKKRLPATLFWRHFLADVLGQNTLFITPAGAVTVVINDIS